MSIVESALERLRQNRAASQPRRTFGKVVEATTPQPTASRIIAVDQAALRAAGMLAPLHQERRIASQYRQIKRPIIAAAMGRGREPVPNGRLVMMASAMPGEGKTFTAVNLALSMAMEKELHVVIIDADVAKPQISKMFGASGERGLLDALSDSTLDMEHLILPTDVPNLSLLPAGAPREGATELLASESMAECMNRLLDRGSNRIFLFDSSPLLLTTEASALADVVGQVVVVVHAERTEHHVLRNALSRLPEECTPVLVLNHSTVKDAGSYYYGYGEKEKA